MEVATQNIKIETNELLNEFKHHLGIENNKRILFSGPFGTGKSTFLKEFSETEKENFFYLKIFPVNYSVSKNEDVFELIKFDLLLQLLGNYNEEIKLEKEDFNVLLKIQVFMMERMKFTPLLYAILGFSEKLGTPLTKLIEAAVSIYGSYEKFSAEIKIDEEKQIHTFLEFIQQKSGSHHEMDTVSELIFDLIGRIKTSNPEKESVLIIDDLDRLDPEHIFRLFNIFSAHYDEIKGENKFGFDKVIFVCDIENIRKIFHHKYGQGVDFSGYIDKFYSIVPFDFNNRMYIKAKTGELLREIRFSSDYLQQTYNFYRNTRFFTTFKALTLSLIEARLLNLRMLIQYPVLNVPEFYIGNGKNSVDSPLIVLFYLLKNFYCSFDILQMKIIEMKEKFDTETFLSNHENQYMVNNEGEIKNLISYCLSYLLPDEKANEDNTKEPKTFFLEKYNCTFHYNGFGNNYDLFYNYIKSTRGNSPNTEPIKLNPYQILSDTFEICNKRGLLR